MDKAIVCSRLKPGLLVKKYSNDSDIFAVVKGDGQVFLRDVCTGEEEDLEDKHYYIVVGKQRSEDIVVTVMIWDWKEQIPMEDLRSLLKERSNKRKKTYVSFPDDGSDSYMAVFTSRPVNDDEGYYLYLKSTDRLFGW